jgi:hypothetical protein
MLYAEILGSRLDGRSRFRVINACSRRRSQRCIGKRVSVLHNPATKWFFKVRMARSAALRLCICGGTNWNSMCLLLLNCFNSSEASLSSQWIFLVENLGCEGISRVFCMPVVSWVQFDCVALPLGWHSYRIHTIQGCTCCLDWM